MTFLRQSWLIASKDLRIFLKDRFAVVFAALFPILFIMLFSVIFPASDVGAREDALELYVATREGPQGISHQVIEGLIASSGPNTRIVIKDFDIALAEVKDRNRGGFLVFPTDFTEAVMTGSGTTLTIYANAQSTNTKAALQGLAKSIAGQVNSTQVSVRSSISLLERQQLNSPSPQTLARIQEVIGRFASGQPVTGHSAEVTVNVEKKGPTRNPAPANWIMPGYLVMFVFFAASMGAESIVAERETQTLERLKVTGARRSSMLGGKYLFSLIRGLGQVAILWTVGLLFFRVDMGVAPTAVIVISLLTVLMASAFGIMLASFVQTRRSAATVGTTLSIALAPLGGCWWPLFITPAWMQFVARFTPHAWATTGFNKLMVFGAGPGDVLPEMLALVGFGVAFAVVGAVRFRTES
ncbi:MAG: ABC transporter permease [Chloroflexi bacterium]|nr:ABC transporter permease [Chloroflexota bacterium]